MALRAMDLSNIQIALFTETKITNEFYARNSSGYAVKATTAASHFQGGVAFAWRPDHPNFSFESITTHGPNVISGEQVSSGHRRLVIGAYVAPSETSMETMQYVIRARNRRPTLPVILLGDFNVDLCRIPLERAGERATRIYAAIANLGLEDMSTHFRQSTLHRCGWTFMRRRNNQMDRGRCDYIFSSDRHQFQSVKITNMRQYFEDHSAVIATIFLRDKSSHKQYL